MKKRTVIIITILMLLSFAGALIGQSPRKPSPPRSYGIHPEVEIDITKTDTIRVVEAYERLMDRYMDLVHSDLAQTKTSATQSLRKLDSIEQKIDSLSARMTRIERALNIPQTRPLRTAPTRPAATQPRKIIEQKE